MTAPAGGGATVGQRIGAAVDAGLAHLRRIDPDAAAEVDTLRRREAGHPTVVIVGETKRGKSSLLNALLAVPGLSPVDAGVATSAYLEFRHGEQVTARAYSPGEPGPVPVNVADLRNWATVVGSLPDGHRPPRRIEVTHPASLLTHLTLVDTPGVGGLDSVHGEIALDAVERATALLFVVDASAPFSKPELDFLVQASRRVNLVLFALTKIDAYPGWRIVLDDDKALLRAHAPRFATAPFFPVSARLAELAGQMPVPEAAAELRREARIEELRATLGDRVAARAEVLSSANVLRTIRSELVTIDHSLGERLRAADPDPGTLEALRAERADFAARKRKDARTWSLTLNTETRRARTDATGRLREHVLQAQEHYLTVIEKATADRVKGLPYELDRTMHAISLRLSAELEHRFRAIGARVLQEVFTPDELTQVLAGLNARLQAEIRSRPRRDAGGPDTVLVVASTAGTAMMAGRLGTAGAVAAIGGGAAAGLAATGVGLVLGLAAGGFMLYRRKVGADRQQARVWLKEVLNEARAALSEEIAHRFTDLEYALTLALDEAVERRVEQLDAQIAQIDQAMAEDKSSRQRRRTALTADRDAVRARIKQLDETLAKVREATAVTADRQPASTGGGR